MNFNTLLGEMIKKLPANVKVDPRLTDMSLRNPMTVNVLLDRINTDLGLEHAREFADLVIKGKVPDNNTVLVTYLMPLKAHPVARQALETLTRAKPCVDCDQPNTWHPER